MILYGPMTGTAQRGLMNQGKCQIQEESRRNRFPKPDTLYPKTFMNNSLSEDMRAQG